MAGPTRAVVTLVASASNAAGATTRGRLDLSALSGAFITFRITNGGTGPTLQCEARILVAHALTLPTAAAEGTAVGDWKQVYVIGGGTSSGTSARGVYRAGPGENCVEVEFTGNTGQAVTVECYATTYVY